MSKQQLRLTKRQVKQAEGRAPGVIIVAVSLTTLISAVALWFTLHFAITSPLSWTGAFGLFGISLLLVVFLEISLAYLPLGRGWRYRLAFLTPILFFTVLIMFYPAVKPLPTLVSWLLVVLAGAFTGGLLATKAALWENNSPPSQPIQEEVHQRHLAVIGSPDPTQISKRLFDLLLAWAGLLVSFPLWLLACFLVWIEDPGPLLFVKNSVGKGGMNFHQYKFRTMVREAETHTGPILSGESDERVLWVGRLLRKTALDELPQLINIIKGEMSFVGPRPQRTVLVSSYLQVMPEYAYRHSVLPGLAGLAQVAGDYYLTPRQKLRYDRLYIRYSSLGFDLKLIFLAFLIAFWYRWQKNWNGRLPRHWLHRPRE